MPEPRCTHPPADLLQHLIAAQAETGWLSPVQISTIADRLDLPRAQVAGVVDFYSFLYDRPVGAYRVLFSDNITDRMQGSVALMQAMGRKLWLEPGKVSEDGLVSLDTTSCTGLCDQGPALLVNGRPITRLNDARINELCDLIRRRVPLDAWPADYFRVEHPVRRADYLLDRPLAAGVALARALSLGPEAVIAEIERAGLRGRGGAGYPTAQKWAACRAAPGERVVVANADEGEPGTFKDRVLLARAAEALFEGMTVCAYAIGARQGFLYLRGEYAFLRPELENILARRRADGLLGANILGQAGFDFDIVIHLGAGAYICGEESALIESLEGKRGIPRNRPPFPVTHGYLGRPTVVNNVETLCAAAAIVARGGADYARLGTFASRGTKLLSVAGDCARPGVYEYPWGVTVAEVLDDCGAANSAAVQVGGPSGACIDAREFGRRLAFEDLPTAGAFTVFDDSRDLFEVAHNYAGFFAHESCGFCTPCRVGTAMQKYLMDRIAAGHGTLSDLAELERLDDVLRSTAHCGLGHTAGNPVRDTLRRFRPAYERRLATLRHRPAFDLDAALAAARRMTGRDDAGAHLGTES